MSHPVPALPMKGALALKVFIFFAFAYILSYAFRSVNAVIAPELMADLKISNAQLGLLSAAYFVGFSAMQIPLGIALDKFGVRRVESILLLMNIQFDDRLSFNYFGTMYLAAVTTLRERKNHYTKLLVI